MAEGKNLVGVDIGTSSIKVCQIKESRKGFSLLKLGYAPLPPQTVVDGQVMHRGAVVDGLSKIYRDAKIKQREVALGVSGQNVIIRKITVPMMTAAELEEQIAWEAEQHIPFDIKDVQVDYEVLRRRPEASQMDLLLVAAKRDQINDFVQLARDAKLKPVICDLDPFAIQNVFEVSRGLPQDQTVALLNVGASLTSLNIIAGGVSAFTREIANGGSVITEEVQKQMGIPYEQADSLKCGLSPEGAPLPEIPQQAAGVIEGVATSIAGEIQRSLDFFMATSGEGEINRIFLTGGSSNVASLRGAVEARARVEVEVWNPVERFAADSKDVDQGLLQQRAQQLSVALGLALRKTKESRQ